MRPRLDARLRATMALGAASILTLVAGARPAPAADPAGGFAAPVGVARVPVTIALRDGSLVAGRRLRVAGRVHGAPSGREVVLEHRTRRGRWTAIARGRTGTGGTFRLVGPASRSGLVRVIAPAAAATAGPAPSSRERGVRVAALVRIERTRTSVRVGATAAVAGRVRPGGAGRLVLLQRRAGRRWITLDRARTRAAGRFALRHRPRVSLSARLRVVTVAGANLAAGRRGAGRLDALRPARASWYGEGQALACGGRLTPNMMGVAHRTLPCGTRVTIRFRGRQVRVPVVDRGPYVGGREWDLGPGVRRALGFDGVGTVWVAH